MTTKNKNVELSHNWVDEGFLSFDISTLKNFLIGKLLVSIGQGKFNDTFEEVFWAIIDWHLYNTTVKNGK